ncbi:MAG: SulP family inorganic anion transporter [Chromatiales bacterium]|nr:SulP family inorganic anion transporter [Chromatiales bacterium]
MYRLATFTENVRGDLFGGVTAAIVALPLALAFGISSGAGPVAGLYGAILVGFFAAVFGGTPSQVSGPTGPMTVVMATVITQAMAEHPDSGLAIAFTTVFIAGLLQIAMGAMKLGRYIILVPYPVISGFMSGIGVIIILLQLGPLMGLPGASGVVAAVRALPEQLANIHWGAAALGVLTIALVFIWRGRVNRRLPAPLLALIVGTVIATFADPQQTIARIGAIPSGLPGLNLPAFEPALLREIVTNSIMLAVLGAIDSLLTSLVADNITATQHDSDQELIGQGLGNAAAGLLGALPGAGATMRTVINIRSGGRGPLSGATHAVLLLAIALGLGRWFEGIPLVVLAGILIKVGVDIIDWPFLRRLHRLPAFSIALMLLVLVLTVFVDLITAVFVGVFIKNIVTIEKLSSFELDSVVLSDGRINADRLTAAEREFLAGHEGDALLMRVSGSLSYGVGRSLSMRLRRFPNVKQLVIDFTGASIIGVSTALIVEDLIEKALQRGADVRVVCAHSRTMADLEKLGVMQRLGTERCFRTLEHALRRLTPVT